MNIRQWLACFPVAALALSASSQAAVIFYTDETAWRAAVQDIETLVTNSANVALADEVGSAPPANTNVGSVLTFQGTTTGFSRSFQLETLQASADFTFDDHEGAGNLPEFDAALSVGDIDNFENDDWRLTLTAGASATAFGFILRDNDGNSGETFSVYGASGLLGSVTPPGSNTENFLFLGFTSDTPWTRVEFDEDSGGDDIAIADFSFANVIPEPSSALLLLPGLASVVLRRRRL